MNNGNYENKLIDAIEAIVDDAVQNAPYDKTIQATIVECVDQTIGQYRVKYEDSTFIAAGVTADVKYKKDTQVYVLIPGNDMSNDKTILGSVEKLGENYIVEPDRVDMFEMIGNNCITNKYEIKLSSYSSDFQMTLYDRTKTQNILQINKNGLENYIKESSALLCGGDFKIVLPQEQRRNGQYGITFDLTFRDNNTGKDIVRSYTFGIDQVTGDPYYVSNYKTIKYVYDIDGDNFKSLDKITVFVKNFPFKDTTKPADIFIKNLEFCGGRLRGEEIYGCILNILTPQGAYFEVADKKDTIKTLEAQIKLNGETVNRESQALEYYWFRENIKVTSDSEKYCSYGKEGWECLNEYTIVGEDSKTKKPLIKWVPGTYSITTTKEKNPAKETRYKCVAIYQDYKPEREVKIINNASEFDITIQSDKGTNFQYDIGNPTLTCLINGVSQNTNENLEYIWGREDENSSFTPLNEDNLINKKYNDAVAAYNKLEDDIKNERVLPLAAETQLKNAENAVKEANTFIRPEKNILHNININSIINEATFKCSVYLKGVLIGTGSIALYNNLNPNKNDYTLILKNKTQVFKYNAKGISPSHTSVEGNAFDIKPLTFDIKDINGDILDWETLKTDIDIEWLVPKDNTLVYIPKKYASSGENDGYLIYKNFTQLEYDINKEYDIFKSNNNILLRIKYKDNLLTETTNFSFIKDGDPGTNGTDYVCKIVPNIAESFNEYPMILNGKLNFTPIDEKQWFKIQLWKNGNLIFNGLSGQSSEHKFVGLTWSILKNNYGKNGLKTVSDESWLTVDNQGKFSYNRNESISNPANIIKCVVTYDGVKIHASLPLITAVADTNYKVKLKKETGFPFVVYSSDGRLPAYNTIPFELVVNKRINGFDEDISKLTTNSEKVNYIWNRLGTIKTWTDSSIIEVAQNLFLLEDQDINNLERGNGNPYLNVKPVDEYDGWCVNDALKCTIKNGNKQVASIHIPIHLLLNRYGQAALNDWDGNHISIDKDGSGVILAPQIGAGVKDPDNGFTGVLMGKVKESNHKEADIGMLGYSDGIRSLFLNSKDGSAIFGKPGKGQIIIDPKQDKGLIYSSNYWIRYNEDGKPSSYDKDNIAGGNIPDSSSDLHGATANGEYGMLINLTEPEIIWGNKNFRVNKLGHITARGGGEIAGWNIDDYQIQSNDNNTGMNHVFTPSAEGSRTRDVQLPTSKPKKALAFWAGGDRFYTTHDGYVRVSDATIGSGTDASHWIYIGNNGSNSTIHTYGKDSLNSTKDGFYIGTDGISLGNNNNFKVDSAGNMSGQKWSITNQGVATFENIIANTNGNIAGWTLTNNTLTNDKMVISAGGSIKGGTAGTSNYWSINNDGTASFTNVAITGGSLNIGPDKFIVDSTGNMSASGSVSISGNLSVTGSGTIAGWTINPTEITKGSIHIDSANQRIYSTSGWWLYNGGKATFNNIEAKTGGNIGGWTINGNVLKSGGITLDGGNAKLKWVKGDAFFACGDDTTHPKASSFNVRDQIAFWPSANLTADAGDGDRGTAIGWVGTDHTTGLILQGNAANSVTISSGSGKVILKQTGGADLFWVGTADDGAKVVHVGAAGGIEIGNHRGVSLSRTRFQTETLESIHLTFYMGLLVSTS